MGGSSGRAAAAVVLCLVLAGRARATSGRRSRSSRTSAPALTSSRCRAHPDLGKGAFYVFLEPAPGAALPEENEVQVSVQPLTGRLPEASYPGTRQDVHNKVQFYAEAEFDQQELWRVRVRVSGAAGTGEVVSEVEPTPTTYGRWDLLIYAFPFVLFGAVFLYAALRRRRRLVGAAASRTRGRVCPGRERGRVRGTAGRHVAPVRRGSRGPGRFRRASGPPRSRGAGRGPDPLGAPPASTEVRLGGV